jgi:hypothetical protein
MIAGHSHRKIPASHRLKRVQQILQRVRFPVRSRFALCGTTKGRWCAGIEITHGIPLKESARQNPNPCSNRAIEAPANCQINRKIGYIPKIAVPQNSAEKNECRSLLFVPDRPKFFKIR